MLNSKDNAAHSLEGLTLKTGWKVKKKIEKSPGDSGSFFSVCYIVEKDNSEAFLKALNFYAFFQLFKGKSIVDIIHEQTQAFQYEKDLLEMCKNKRLTKVSIIIDEGEEFLDNYAIPNVPYLIFELADGDIRKHIDFSIKMDIAWKLKSLHDVAVGLKQLHGIQIGHQDLKPSNILLYNNLETSKITDLGRSLCAEIQAPHEKDGDFPGDFSYAPPEFLYRYIIPDWDIRIRATDIYMFGSLVVFYFTGANMTALIGKNIDPTFKWTNWNGSFNDVKSYLTNGFYLALAEFGNMIVNQELKSELTQIVEYCCFPIPEKRGHPKSLTSSPRKSQFEFERIVSKFDLLSKKAIYLFK